MLNGLTGPRKFRRFLLGDQEEIDYSGSECLQKQDLLLLQHPINGDGRLRSNGDWQSSWEVLYFIGSLWYFEDK